MKKIILLGLLLLSSCSNTNKVEKWYNCVHKFDTNDLVLYVKHYKYENYEYVIDREWTFKKGECSIITILEDNYYENVLVRFDSKYTFYIFKI